MASLLGKMSTTSVRRRSSLFKRSWGLLDQPWPVVAGDSTEGVSSSAAEVVIEGWGANSQVCRQEGPVVFLAERLVRR